MTTQLPWRRIAVENVVVLAAFAAAGAGCGWLWHHLWDAPRGFVAQGEWFPLGFEQAERLFTGTALYVVIGFVAGLLLGVASGLVVRGSELVTLVVVLAGSALAAWLAHLVGTAANPTDPQVLARTSPDGTRLPGILEVAGHTPYVAWPLGALVGLAVTYVLTIGVSAGVAEARKLELSTGAQPPPPATRETSSTDG